MRLPFSFPFSLRQIFNIIFVIIVPVVLGVWLADQFDTRQKPEVGIVVLDTDIWFLSAKLVTRQLEAARDDPNIKAVVLRIDSPGGAVVPTQQMFLEVLSLREEMPVVGSIDNMAASGGFYLAMATDPTYAKPSSMVGNVGVWSVAPQDLAVNDVILASGPFKLTATNHDEFLRDIERIKQEFFATIYSQRGDRAVISEAELTKGLIYSGRDAMKHGLIDLLGSETDAIEKAADMAGLSDYNVVNLQRQVYEEEFGEDIDYFFNPWQKEQYRWIGAADLLSGERTLPPGNYLLHDIPFREIK
ncbi:MAG: hypothetical protein B6242_07740 [Anaerolineaceae bacterium 4572_78]|nr:MAG: hypothetical protein B6242_07740 [Anaerolineaceae bacterium 4572_78]